MTIINLQSGGQSEQWLTIKDGRIIRHVENDGYRVARNGLEAREQEMTMEEAREQFDQFTVGQIWEALSQQFL
jgi:hypothetical protein